MTEAVFYVGNSSPHLGGVKTRLLRHDTNEDIEEFDILPLVLLADVFTIAKASIRFEVPAILVAIVLYGILFTTHISATVTK